MKQLLIFLGCIFMQSVFLSQNAITTIPPNYLKYDSQNEGYDNIILPQPTIPPGQDEFYYYHGQVADHSHNAMQDENGNLLFFIVDDMVYDRDGYLINRISSDVAEVKGVTETLIIPDPNICGQFYIVLKDEVLTMRIGYYSHILQN